MNTCRRCNESFNDGVQCSSCKKFYDFACAGITEAGYRKLGPDRRAVWKCTTCKSTVSGSGACEEPMSLDKIFKEIVDLKKHLSSLDTLRDDVKTIKNDLQDLRASCEFNSSKLDECNGRVDAVEEKLQDVDLLRNELKSTQEDLARCKQSLAAKEQWSRLNNVEIKGVPLKKDENLFEIVDSVGKHIKCPIPKTSINYVARVPLHNSKDKSIVVNFTNRYMKEDFVAAARSIKHLAASDIGFRDSAQRVYVNDHLTSDMKNLLTKTKLALKDKLGYRYVWVKYGKIHVRQNDTSKIHIIQTENDLKRLS
ncbi:uncharacterized protein LOC132904025 [Amyelois transitella]|uniref:uncharacterized protein LOC132904025 n=1 Tax=Amyelois transitella TaxID=680683 RepID=UPI00298F9F35|nr:uncharacterized protein LOC132904025 [Amyelois transitella]